MDSRGGLPPRWKNCPRMGDLIANIFVPFKVPLSELYHSLLSPESYFTPQMCIGAMRSKQFNIGLWIDLTNTNRYYERRSVTFEDIEYVKLRLKGHGECPSDEQVHEFIEECRSFLHKHPKWQIAVHCTHGFNRTGFLICSFLVMAQKWDIEYAINEFAKARPPGIYKQHYIDELFRRFGSYESRSIPAPELPDWCNEDSQYEDDDAETTRNGAHLYHRDQMPSTSTSSVHTHSSSSHHSHHHHPQQHHHHQSSSNNNNNLVSDQVNISHPYNGVYLVRDQHKSEQIQHLCSRICGFNREGFPGSHPVSLTRDNIHLIATQDYMVSWKADGTRYMLLIIGPGEMYFLDRDYRVYELRNVTFLKKNTQNEPLTNTLLDGELVVDVVNGKNFPRYLIYDIICVDNLNVSGYNFRERLDFIYKQVFMPRENAKKTGVIDRNKEPIGIRIKDFCELKDTFKYFSDKFQKMLSHEIDGLIFQPVKYPYTNGRCDMILKWKPPSHNSVDFRLKISKVRSRDHNDDYARDEYVGLLFVGREPEPFSEMEVTKELRHYDNKIIECRFDMERNCWVFMRERTDKSFPNAKKTAMAVWKSMVEPVTKDYLLEYIANSRM